MTSSPPSGSKRRSRSFEKLHPKIQRWIWQQEWSTLRQVQEQAIPPILKGRDALLAAPTAGGKTEAAFFPIASVLARQTKSGLGCLCVSPLKALINDQHSRLEALCEAVDVSVHAWHGDISQRRKQKLLDAPSGVLLITPESLEALFARRGPKMRGFWKSLHFAVVDELHAFIGAERGRQLQSLLHRVDRARGEAVPRIGLSATLGDMSLAAEFLRPGGAEHVTLIEDTRAEAELKIQVRGYVQVPPRLGPKQAETAEAAGEEVTEEDITEGGTLEIAEHLFRALRGGNHLVFANSRRRVEEFSDLLYRRCERERLPGEFFPHHGSLARGFREDAEALLKDRDRPATLIATTTLELGIDVGQIETIAQVGVPPSVAALRQRIGRSGRREDAAAVLRVYLAEREIKPDCPVQDALRAQLFQSLAMVELLLERFCEPPDPNQLHLSTLVQQLLSLIAERGGVRPKAAHKILCASGPFKNVASSEFAQLLRSLSEHQLINQADDGDLVLGLEGEKLVDHYSFYTAFQTPEEFRLVAREKELGSLPITFPLFEGALIIFAGRRWRITHVDLDTKTLLLEPAAGGTPPQFDGDAFFVHGKVREKMRDLYEARAVPGYLNRGGQGLLREGRDTYERLRLNEQSILTDGNDVHLFPWTGTRAMQTLVLWLARHGLQAESQGILVSVPDASRGALEEALKALAEASNPDPLELTRAVEALHQEKYDHFLPEPLARANYARRALDVPGAQRAAKQMLEQCASPLA